MLPERSIADSAISDAEIVVAAKLAVSTELDARSEPVTVVVTNDSELRFFND
jgi:hypothetical protein